MDRIFLYYVTAESFFFNNWAVYFGDLTPGNFPALIGASPPTRGSSRGELEKAAEIKPKITVVVLNHQVYEAF